MMEKRFPEHMTPIGDSTYCFDCHPDIDCFTVCCTKVDLILYPYDIIRLKKTLKLDSEQFLRQHTYLERGGDNPFFPTVKLKLDDSERCPFLADSGCGVYGDRPSACRTYPLERAVDRSTQDTCKNEYYFMTDHSYCHGHKEKREWTVHKWIRNQQLLDYNSINELWASMDTIFRDNPWKGEGYGGEKQQVAFMVCYNIDGFRRFCLQHNLFDRFRIDRSWKRGIDNDDVELLKFGFEWLSLILTQKSRRLVCK